MHFAALVVKDEVFVQLLVLSKRYIVAYCTYRPAMIQGVCVCVEK